MNTFHNRVKARLYRKRYLGFTQADYTDAATSIKVIDVNNPTKEELAKGVNYLIDKHRKNEEKFRKEEKERQEKYMYSAFRERRVIECAVTLELSLKSKGITVPYSELVQFADRVIDRK